MPRKRPWCKRATPGLVDFEVIECDDEFFDLDDDQINLEDYIHTSVRQIAYPAYDRTSMRGISQSLVWSLWLLRKGELFIGSVLMVAIFGVAFGFFAVNGGVGLGLFVATCVSVAVLLILIGIVFLVLAVPCSVLGRRSIKRKVLLTRGQICPICLYDLSARPHNEDICTECGEYTPRRECVRLWCKLLRSRF